MKIVIRKENLLSTSSKVINIYTAVKEGWT